MQKLLLVSNIYRLIFGHLNINSLRQKFDAISEQVKGSINVLIISKTILDDSFPKDQFLIGGYQTPFYEKK